eukprot:8669709-Pyramimonas_sp.AAC.1
MFSRRTNRTRSARVCSHDGPIVRGKGERAGLACSSVWGKEAQECRRGDPTISGGGAPAVGELPAAKLLPP